MDALQRINRHYGITVLCNLHSLDLARTYCDRLVGMAAGRVVFDGAPAALTDARGARPLRPGSRRSAGPSQARSADFVAGVASPACALAGPERHRHPPQQGDLSMFTRRLVLGAALAASPFALPVPPTRRTGKPSIRSSSSPSSRPRTPPASTDRYTPFVELSLEGARHQGHAARRQRLRGGHRRPARRQHPDRLLRPGLLRPRRHHRRQDRAVRHRREQRRHEGLLLGVLRAGRQPLQNDRGSQGQESRPRRSRTRPRATTCRASS